METLYVTQENCRIRAEGQHLRLTRRGETLTTIPLTDLRTLVIFDTVSLTTPALDLLLANGTDILYMSKWGKLKARILPVQSSGAVLRIAQYSAFLNQEKRLNIAKFIVAAKIHNQISVIKKYKYHDTNPEFDDNLKEIEGFMALLDQSSTLEEIMGTEGISARYYWGCFKDLLKQPAFTRREYRPSPDYVNALLNLGYAFLANEITTCLITKKLDPEVGFLHSIHHGRNSLTLDIMEEFRAPFVDAWILHLLNRKQLKGEHFHTKQGDWLLTDVGFRNFCGLYHDRVPLWRDRFRKQIDTLKTALLKGTPYEPYRE